MIPESLLANGNLLPNAKILYGVLLSRSREKGYCWATNKALGETMNLGVDMVSKLVSQLVHQGLIDAQMVRNGAGYERRITVNADFTPLTESTPHVTQSAPPTDHSTHIKDKITDKGKDKKTPAATAAVQIEREAFYSQNAWKPCIEIWFQYVAYKTGGKRPDWTRRKAEPASLKDLLNCIEKMQARSPGAGGLRYQIDGREIAFPSEPWMADFTADQRATTLAFRFCNFLTKIQTLGSHYRDCCKLTILANDFDTILSKLTNASNGTGNTNAPVQKSSATRRASAEELAAVRAKYVTPYHQPDNQPSDGHGDGVGNAQQTEWADAVRIGFEEVK